MNNEPKISVIVPVYKVEPYLRQCLDGIVGQTYKNLQIILVDDGSPDKCGAICDEYAAKDERIVVVHQENGGLSSARNTGLQLVRGEYLGFVDSDDWIEADMYEYLLDNIQRYGADLAVCSRLECYKDRTTFKGWSEIEVFDKEQALAKLLENGQMQNYVWDKLYKRYLFEDVSFPEGKTFEDVAIMYQVFAGTNKVVCLPKAGYCYRQRSDSIVGDISLSSRINHYLAAKKRCEDMVAGWPQFEPLLLAQCVASAVGMWCGYLSSSKEDRRKYKKDILEISGFCKEHYKQALQYSNMGFVGRAVLRLTPYTRWWAFALSWLLGKVYRLKHGRNL